ncbi:MAG: HEAT repeat domain-containing protein [Nitrospiraceae bacterium]|nr:MAG: HEAT repeat domain-containing protein [Nitrospiraceae bacterium]
MKRLFITCVITIVVFSSAAGFCSFSQGKPGAPSASSMGSLTAKLENNLLSVDIKDVSLEEVLRKLSDQTGISFSLPPSLCNDRLMVRFANFEIDEAIDKVLGPYDRVFVYDQMENNTEEVGRLREVRIYIRGTNKNGASEKPMIISASKSSPVSDDTNGKNKPVLKTSPKENTVKSLKEWSKDLQEGDETAKINAVQGLARMGEGALGPLTSALEDANPEVSKAAESALTDLYASLEEENNLPGSDRNTQEQTIEGAPRFAIDTAGAINEGSGNQMEVDIRLSDVPEKLITSGFMIRYDPSQMNITGADVYDGSSLSGPWDSEMTNKVPNPSGPGTYMVIVGNLGSVAPDQNDTINIARLYGSCTGNCEFTIAPVPDFDTSVGNSSTVYDSKMGPTKFTFDY